MLRLPKSGRAHRAMVDAEVASHLWCRLQNDIAQTYGLKRIDHALMARLQKTSKAKVATFLGSLSND
jgi:DNA polymerase III subunit epsilon